MKIKELLSEVEPTPFPMNKVQPANPPRLMATADTPDRGGKLWVGGKRRPGSLSLSAHGGTLARQLGVFDGTALRTNIDVA